MTTNATDIWYGLSSEAEPSYRQTLERLAAASAGGRICEIGGGANPALSLDFVRKHRLKYTIVDISADELDKAPREYNKVLTDLSAPQHALHDEFDFVFSMWCCEHVKEAATFHRNIFDRLVPGGQALHLFPTLFSPPFVVNRLMPEWLSEPLLLLLQPHRSGEGDHGKFPAYYRWCRGPLQSQQKRFEELGYSIDEYASFFGHSGEVAFGSGYLNRIPPLRAMHEWLARRSVRHPSPWLTTLAYVVLSRPTECGGIPTDKDFQEINEPVAAV